jgi:CRP/FNR family transcriptional regulator
MGDTMAGRQDTQHADIPATCKSCQAGQGGLCGALKASQRARLAQVSSRHQVSAGSDLSDDETYSIVLSGVVKLTRNLSDGRQQIVGFHFARDFLGRPCTARWPIKTSTLTTVELCSFPKAIIERMMEDTPALGRVLLEHTLRKLDEARNWMAALGRKTASEKVASFLLMIATNMDAANNPKGSTNFDLPLTRADIGDFLGLTIETVSRELTRLRTDGVIRIANKRHISLESLAKLDERCGD